MRGIGLLETRLTAMWAGGSPAPAQPLDLVPELVQALKETSAKRAKVGG